MAESNARTLVRGENSSQAGAEAGFSGGSGRRILGALGGFLLGAVFLLAAWSKAIEPIPFVEEIRGENLDFFLSAPLVAVIALALEAGLGLALVMGVRRRWLIIPTALLVAFFLFLTGRNYYLVSLGLRDPSRSCGCFGSLLNRTAAEAFWQDLFLLLPPLLLLIWGRERNPRRFPAVRTALAGLAALGIVVFAMTYPQVPLRLSTLAAPPVEPTRFIPFEGFEVFVGGEPAPEARIYHSEETVQFLILSSQLSAPVVLDLKTQEVKTLLSTAVAQADGRLALSAPLEVQPAGNFQVVDDSVIFTFDGRELRLKNR